MHPNSEFLNTKETTVQNEVKTVEVSKLKDYLQLTKVRLSVSVVFSAAAGYVLGAPTFSLPILILLVIGGILVVGASNGFNQIIEREQDAKMDRTKDRPIPAGRMGIAEALIASTLMALVGLGMLFAINPLSAAFGAASIVLYTLAYTPMKAMSPWAVFVGAIPGAIPFMLGWVAATNDFGIEPGTLFAIQFIWQFPHFWAIGWLMHDDYAKAGYNLLPSGKRDKNTGIQIVMYSFYLILVSIVPAFGITGSLTLSVYGAIIIGLLGFYMFSKAYKLYKEQSMPAAKKLLMTSIMYLTLVQLVYIIDKFI